MVCDGILLGVHGGTSGKYRDKMPELAVHVVRRVYDVAHFAAHPVSHHQHIRPSQHRRSGPPHQTSPRGPASSRKLASASRTGVDLLNRLWIVSFSHRNSSFVLGEILGL